jgi:glycosyltransferase involved in cell wall biosynthesis
MKKIVIASNTAWSLYNFRAGLIRALISSGYDVVVVAPYDEYAPRLFLLGCRYVSLSMDNKGTNPIRDLWLLSRFFWLLLCERPFVYLGYTIKPNVYGSLAAHLLGIPVINNIAGLGVVFIKDSVLTKLVKLLYRLALSRSFKVFFQNNDDKDLFVNSNLVREYKADRLPGSGVDLSHYSSIDTSNLNVRNERNPFRFLLAARMIWDKGIGDYVEAARIVKLLYPQVEFCLLGFLDVINPAAVSKEQMALWVDEGVIQYLGVTDNMKPFLASADCVVLPSFYREGVPRALLEAAAMGRPIITSDAAGCRDAIDDGVSGFICQPRNAHDLADKMMRIIALLPSELAAMGLAGRAKMEREFDEKIVIDRYLEVLQSITKT